MVTAADPDGSAAGSGVTLKLRKAKRRKDDTQSRNEADRKGKGRLGKVKRKLARADSLVDAGKVDEALVLYASVRDLAPHRRSLTRSYAQALRRAGRLGDSAIAFREWAREPPDLQVLRGLVSELLAAGEQEQALLTLKHACTIAPQDAELLFAFGRALAGQGRDEEAAATLAEACRVEPDNPRLLKQYASLLSRLNRIDEATQIFERLRIVSADSVESLVLLAGVLVRSGQKAEAEARYRQAVESAPDNLAARLGLARTLNALARPEAALEQAEAAVRIGPTDLRALKEQAIALGALRRFEAAIEVEESMVSLSGRSASALLRLARVMARAGRPERAIQICDEALLADGVNAELHRIRGTALASLARRSEAVAAFEAALAIDPRNAPCLAALGTLKQAAGDLEAALALLDRALAQSPDSASLLLFRSELRYRIGDAEGARCDASAAVSIDPSYRGELYVRFMGNSDDALSATGIDVCFIEPVEADAVRAAVAHRFGGRVVFEASGLRPEPGEAVEVKGSWRDRIAACSAPHILVVPGGVGWLPGPAALRARSGDRIGIVGDDPAGSASLWRRDLLVLALGVFEHVQFPEFAALLAPRLARRSLHPPAQEPRPLPAEPIGGGREVWLCSPEGIRLVGGVERYLRDLVPVYRDLGFHPVVVGIVPSMSGREAEGVVDGVPFLNLSRDGTALRTAALVRNPALVHATSSVGLDLSAACDGLAARVTYGIHFWSEMFHGNGISCESIDQDAQPRPEFGPLAGSFDQIYVNSDFTARMLGGNFDIGAQRIFPIGVEVDAADAEPRRGDHFLLLSGRPDKGLDFVLDIARQMPDRPFKIVYPPGLKARTSELVRAAGLDNVEVIDWTSETDSLYRAARAVLVPSYRMIETFSRVTIEAQSFGVPVVGSDCGNVSLLLAGSGVSLPADATAWSGELERLWTDEAYWRVRSSRARDNARRFSASELRRRTGRMVRAATLRLGVGVGCGLGNIVQCTPAIRRISEHFGAPVDVLLREDFPGCRALLEGSPHVGAVLPADRYGPLTRFDSLLVFDGFGPLLPRLNADRLVVSRENYKYMQMQPIHESRHNLMCAERLLGVPWQDEDAAEYFVGNVTRKPVPRRIGLHAGCKPGRWEPKRWPYFALLGEGLRRRGYELVSFGAPDEYVDGTVDATGTDLATTIRGIAACSYFIANDSGLMHVADGLGIPLTSVFAPTSVERYGPLGSQSRVVRIHRACSPCHPDLAKLAGCVCIADIPVVDVLAAVDAGLAVVAAGGVAA
jgi:tetratricopeptide (TPR) repeat protein/ADP-heptose:LPS heptosyltransferase/glycosyltransferase involved in cell wall biosynthesis